MTQDKILTIGAVIVVCGVLAYGISAQYIPELRFWKQTIPTLSDEEKVVRSRQCSTKFFQQENNKINEERKDGRQITDPRIFYSPVRGHCISTYLELDKDMPAAEDYNVFTFYDLERSKELFTSNKEKITTYEQYLERLEELE